MKLLYCTSGPLSILIVWTGKPFRMKAELGWLSLDLYTMVKWVSAFGFSSSKWQW